MRYDLEVKISCKESIIKLCKKNPNLKKALEKKIEKVVENPHHFKPMRYKLAGLRRVHVMKSFVLQYEIKGKTVALVSFSHHDDAYRR